MGLGIFGSSSRERTKNTPTEESSIERIKDVVQYIARELVTNPDEVEISIIEVEDHIKLELTAAKADIGKVIGKEGRMATALRSIVYALASKARVRVILDIVSN